MTFIRTLFISSALLLMPFLSLAQTPEGEKKNDDVVSTDTEDSAILDTLVIEGDTLMITNEFLDKYSKKRKNLINDYSMLGVQAGAGAGFGYFNPSFSQTPKFTGPDINIVYTHYCKMFGYMPYFGWQAGIFYTQDGYKFKQDEDSGYIGSIFSGNEAKIHTLDASFLSHFHVDITNFKIIANVGLYAGYRLAIERSGKKVVDSLAHNFHPCEHRFDYGVKASLGFGYVIEPIEIHLLVNYKHSFEPLYDVNYYSQYYYRFAYPLNVNVTLGVHVHLTTRYGKSRSQLKKEAKEYIQRQYYQGGL